MNMTSLRSTMVYSFLMAFALLLSEASGHMHDVILGPAMTPDGEWLFLRSRDSLFRSRDQGDSFTPLRNPDNINWDKQTGGGPPTFILSPDFQNTTSVLFGTYLSFDAGDTWNRNLEEELVRKKWKGVQYEVCANDPNPAVFSPDFANDETIFAVACHQDEDDPTNTTLATLLYTADFGDSFVPVLNLKGFEYGSWRPVLTPTTDEIYFQRLVGLNSEIYTPIAGTPKKWKRFKTLKNFELQNIREDHSTSGGILVIDRNSQTLHRLSQDKELTPIPLPSAATATAGDHLLMSAYSHKGVGSNSSLVVIRSLCQTRQNELLRFGVECPGSNLDDGNLKDYVIHSTDDGLTWNNITVVDWFYEQGGGESLYFDVPEFNNAWGIPGTPTVFLGAFAGLFRSDDHGESWVELDTISTDITGMSASIISQTSIQLSVCTYTQSCWSGVVDVKGLKDKSISRLPDGSLEQVVRNATKIGDGEYSSIGFSDGIGFLADELGVRRYADGFTGNYTELDSIPFVPNPVPAKRDASNVHGIKFSPDFENDDTMFIAGFNLGIFRSFDRGLTFEKVFDATTQPEVPTGSDVIGLFLSPDFDTSGVLFTYVTNGRKSGVDNLLFQSENSGSNWTVVDQGGNPPRLLSLAIVDDNSSADDKYSLVGVTKLGNVKVNRRKGDGQEFGKWDNLRYPKNGKEDTKFFATGYCHDSVLGTTNNGKMYMSFLTGGIAYGFLKGDRFTKAKASGKSQRFRFGGNGQAFVKNERKTWSESMLDIKGVMFGAFFNEIWMSLNDGKQWTSIYKLDSRPPRFSGCLEEDKSNCRFREIKKK